MRRADRLLQLVQALRRRKGPTTAKVLADELEVGCRTIYRDIADLQAANVPIQGAAGVGYVLGAGYDLPPLMFDANELEAIVLGARLVAERGDPELARAARDVLAKVAAVVPKALARQMDRAALLVHQRTTEELALETDLPLLRQATREHRKVRLEYLDLDDRTTSRIVWPLGIYFFSHVTLLCAWCELRGDYRSFRASRVQSCELLPEGFDAQNGALLQTFLETHFRTARVVA